NDSSDNVSFYDGDLKLKYDVARGQTVSFYGIGGHTLYDVVNPAYTPTPSDIQHATNDVMMGRVGWLCTVDPHLLVETHAAYLQSPDAWWNVDRQPLENDHHAEWVAGGSLVWSWQKEHVLEAGWMTRRVSNSSVSTGYNANGTVAGSDAENGLGWKNDGYVQQASSFFGNRLHLVGGLRLDTAEQFDIHPVSPQLSASLQ